jgi:hypothetical protein
VIRFLPVVLVTGLRLFAAPEPSNPQQLFNKVRALVIEAVENAPRYTCVETVERTWFKTRGFGGNGCAAENGNGHGALLLTEQDRLRLDVGIVGESEVFSWHGDNAFRTGNIGQLVSAGPITSGMFFSLLADVFANGKGRYVYHGLRLTGAKRVAVFSYLIPLKVSHYTVQTPGGQQAMEYSGEFTVDPESGAIESLGVVVSEVPRSLSTCRIQLSARYQELTVNGRSLRIPQSFRMALSDRGGTPSEVNAHYSGCHEFVGESVIRFDDVTTSAADSAASEMTAKGSLPAKLLLKLRLVSTINTDSAWTGDLVQAEVVDDVLNRDGRRVVPKNSVVTGRIVQLQHFLGNAPYWVLAIRFDRLRTPTQDFQIRLKQQKTTGATHNGSSPASAAKRIAGNAPAAEKRGTGYFQISGNRFTLDQHFVTEWTSETMKAAENP